MATSSSPRTRRATSSSTLRAHGTPSARSTSRLRQRSSCARRSAIRLHGAFQIAQFRRRTPGRCFHRCTATRRRARSRPRRSADRTCSTCARSRARTPRTGFASSSAHPWLPTSSATAPRRRRRCRPAARPAGPTAAWRPQLTARRWPRCATPSRRDRTVRRRASSAQWAWARLLALRSSRPWVLHTCAGGSGPLACLCEPLQGIYRGDIHTSLPHLATAQPSSTSDHVRMVLERHSHTVVLEPDLEHVLEWREDLAQHRGVALRHSLVKGLVVGPSAVLARAAAAHRHAVVKHGRVEREACEVCKGLEQVGRGDDLHVLRPDDEELVRVE
mmetsp:Transcript_3280/g.10231  ORF Transcript_3280/g.10231 Transcript_3280/m.10231 type:complete len:331 (+) Transcript_3280:1232-2224(+)